MQRATVPCCRNGCYETAEAAAGEELFPDRVSVLQLLEGPDRVIAMCSGSMPRSVLYSRAAPVMSFCAGD